MTPEQRFWAKVDRSGGPDACWPWLASRNPRSGYGQAHWRGKTARAHRVAWAYVRGEMLPSQTVLCHSCDNPPCVNPAHLWPGSQADNLADMRAKGRGTDWSNVSRGVDRPNARLDEERVRELRRRRAAGETIASIAEDFGVDESTVGLAARGKSWKHVA